VQATPAEKIRSKKPGRDVLNEAKMAQLLYVPVSRDAMRFAGDLSELTIEHEALVAPRIRMRRAADLKTFQEAIAAFSADLILHSGNEQSEGFCYRAANREAMAGTMVSHISFEKLVPWWKSLGLLEATPSIQVKETWDGAVIDVDSYSKARRFRPTAKLLDLAALHGITSENIKVHFQKDVSQTIPVTVRDERFDSNGKRIRSRSVPVKDLKKYPRYATEIEKIRLLNDNLAKAGFDLQDPPRLYRLFNRGNQSDFNFDKGGRLYCASEDNWQQMSSEERAKITRQGMPTVEIDVQASHLFILYALNNQKLHIDQDPYRIPGVERSVVKGLFAAITGAGKLPERWPQKLSKSYKKENGRTLAKTYRFGKVLGDLLELHPVLRTIKKGKLDWARLQYEESECFLWAMRTLWDPFKVGALPVHDSLIVLKEDEKIAKDYLGIAYENQFGYRPLIRVK
jgi:hypothetical protein